MKGSRKGTVMGTSIHKHEEKLRLQKEGYKNLADRRSPSSAFQQEESPMQLDTKVATLIGAAVGGPLGGLVMNKMAGQINDTGKGGAVDAGGVIDEAGAIE